MGSASTTPAAFLTQPGPLLTQPGPFLTLLGPFLTLLGPFLTLLGPFLTLLAPAGPHPLAPFRLPVPPSPSLSLERGPGGEVPTRPPPPSPAGATLGPTRRRASSASHASSARCDRWERDQAMARVILIRHGESEANRDGRSLGRADSPLTDRGRRQVAALGRALAGDPIGRVLSSPLRRAADAADAVAAPTASRSRRTTA